MGNRFSSSCRRFDRSPRCIAEVFSRDERLRSSLPSPASFDRFSPSGARNKPESTPAEPSVRLGRLRAHQPVLLEAGARRLRRFPPHAAAMAVAMLFAVTGGSLRLAAGAFRSRLRHCCRWWSASLAPIDFYNVSFALHPIRRNPAARTLRSGTVPGAASRLIIEPGRSSPWHGAFRGTKSGHVNL